MLFIKSGIWPLLLQVRLDDRAVSDKHKGSGKGSRLVLVVVRRHKTGLIFFCIFFFFCQGAIWCYMYTSEDETLSCSFYDSFWVFFIWRVLKDEFLRLLFRGVLSPNWGAIIWNEIQPNIPTPKDRFPSKAAWGCINLHRACCRAAWILRW